MDLSKKIFAVFAILCIVASAGVVCASEDGDGAYAGSNYDDRGGWAGSNYEDHGGWAGSNYEDHGGWAGSQYNETANSQNHTAAGAPVNSTGHNITANKTANVTNTTNKTNATSPFNMLATGNPILILIVVIAVVGGIAVYRRNK